MKTPLTLAMEETLYAYCRARRYYVIEEVAMPEESGIVDTLAASFKGDRLDWRCFELKASKSDFHSSAKLTFVGNLNYFVLPAVLFEQVKEEIPKGIGVLIYRPYTEEAAQENGVPGYFTVRKTARRQAIPYAPEAMLRAFLQRFSGEVHKAKRMETGLSSYQTAELTRELGRRLSAEDDFLTQQAAIEALNEEKQLLLDEVAHWHQKYEEARRNGLPLL
ncbi:MAG: hypothetical protein LKJ03_04470 [Enterococcaceae bacterium]|jgi:hypothetical protein|nr:hypothetical protein [Enterococcaceae bacterium]MCI1920261.1 hypothetical protein [Enterococcaceae bacterium]